MSSAAAAASKSVADPSTLSPVKQMFFGRLAGKQMFPFPCALTEEQKESIDAMAEPVGKFFDEKIDSAQIDWDHKIPDEVMQGLRDMGLFGLQIDPEFNGLGLSNTEYARIVEELVMDPAIAVTLMAHQSIGLKGILLCGTQAQKEEYLPRLATGEHIAAFALTEPSAGSDAAGIKTKAVLADDGSGDWVMNGSKSESGAGIADCADGWTFGAVIERLSCMVLKAVSVIRGCTGASSLCRRLVIVPLPVPVPLWHSRAATGRGRKRPDAVTGGQPRGRQTMFCVFSGLLVSMRSVDLEWRLG